VNIDQPKAPVPAGSSFNITPRLIAAPNAASDIGVTVNLTNQNGSTTNSATYLHQFLQANSPQNFTLSITNAQIGSYKIGIIITNTNETTIQRFDNLGTVAVE
jgi:hypothetical protein